MMNDEWRNDELKDSSRSIFIIPHSSLFIVRIRHSAFDLRSPSARVA
jgi:hypothetical protein